MRMSRVNAFAILAAAAALSACAAYVVAPPMNLPKPSTLTAVILPIQDDSAQATQAEMAKAPAAENYPHNDAQYAIKHLNEAIVPDLTQSGLFKSVATSGDADVVIQPTLKVSLQYEIGGAANARDPHHVVLELVAKKGGQEVMRHTYDKNFEEGIGMMSSAPLLDKAWNQMMTKLMQDIRADLATALGEI